MGDTKKYPEQLVFGLDIGTRSIVGTVGYRQRDKFYVVAQKAIEHETRAMLDGQIHDIGKVAATIRAVKEALEAQIELPLRDVCIAAAGRVLRTISVHVDETLAFEREVTEEDTFSLSTKGIELAYDQMQQDLESDDVKYYCVGYSVTRYYMNGFHMGNLVGHNARNIGADLIATFLPDDVVDGLYKAVSLADLQVVNLTLEPIAAIGLAIPEQYRMLNIALVDVGAGTSDISITREGTIAAFGMIPIAGDALTEVIGQHCLTDFNTAEKIKRDAEKSDPIVYQDIMGLDLEISRADLLAVTEPVIRDMTKQVSDKIKELNGDKAVSAVFVVGGGGRLEGYTQSLAGELGIPEQRVAIRGQQVMQNIEFLSSDLTIDSLLVTPIGICLSFYEQSNNFIYVSFNEKRVKLYDNGKLTVTDAALQAQFPNEDLFPKRGKELNYTVNGTARMTRGLPGEAAEIYVNGSISDIHASIKTNDQIKVIESTAGADAALEIRQLPEFGATMDVLVNEKKVVLPKFVSVNGELQSEYYDIKDGDVITMLDYYTVKQIADFMDVILAPGMNLYVNNKLATLETPVYANFSVVWTLEELKLSDLGAEDQSESGSVFGESDPKGFGEERSEEAGDEEESVFDEEDASSDESLSHAASESEEAAEDQELPKPNRSIIITVNGLPVTLSGKPEYVFVDVFNFIDFDLSKPKGSSVVTEINGREAQYMEPLREGDALRIFWKGSI